MGYNFREQLKKCEEAEYKNTFESIFKDRSLKEYNAEQKLTAWCDEKIKHYRNLKTTLVNNYRRNMFPVGSRVLLVNNRDGEQEGEVVEVKKTGIVMHTTRVNNNVYDTTGFMSFKELLNSDHVYIMKAEDKEQ